MTKEVIIVDDVNVAGCEYLLSTGYCKIQTVFQQNGNEKPYGNFLECHLCKDCYYKQLKRLQVENEDLKKYLNKIEKQMRTILIVANGVNNNYRPVKRTTKNDCYRVLGYIQELLQTNKINAINEELKDESEVENE